MKPDCYECEYRGTVTGSCHSSCHYPLPIQGKVEGITVKGNKHGIQNGWFNHPFNFDPLWLEECTGFKQKEQS